MVQIHCETEAAVLIARGFFQETTIRGIPHYINISFAKENTVTETTAESVSMNKALKMDELMELESNFESFIVSSPSMIFAPS